MPFATLVIGPAGVGKTTMAHALQVHGQTTKRAIAIVNLDPAADSTPYRADVDIRELIRVEDAMTEMGFGPNGGLIYCMEYLLTHIDWLEEKVNEFGEDDTLVVDCPGQLELYTHVPVMPRVVAALERWGVRLCVAYLMDAVAVHDASKFIAGSLAGLAAMLQIPAPRLTVLSKSDLVPSTEALEDFLELQSTVTFLENSERIERKVYGVKRRNFRYTQLQHAICRVVDDHALLSFVPFSIKDDDSPAHVLSFSDHLTQYADHAEVRIREDERGYNPQEDAYNQGSYFPEDDDDGNGGGEFFGSGRSLEEAARAIFGPGALGGPPTDD